MPVAVYIGPRVLPGKQSNWPQTEPGKGIDAILRLTGQLGHWFTETWRPGEIEVAGCGAGEGV